MTVGGLEQQQLLLFLLHLQATLTTCDGLKALATYSTGSFDQRTMSIFSPFSSSTMRCTRCPFGPTQEPTGSHQCSLHVQRF